MAIANITNNILTDSGVATSSLLTTDTSQAITANKSFTVGFSLGSEGSGNQTSFFRNTSSIFSGSGGSNIFGFNNSNNIYFGKGLNNGGVLQWNNTTATRYYTLPDADGTIALTSNIPANAVGGTGTTNTLPKFTGSTTIGDSLFTDNGINGGFGGANYTSGTGLRSFNISAQDYPGISFWANNQNTATVFGLGFTGTLTLSADPNNIFLNSRIVMSTDGTDRLTIFNDGNVSIGNSPTDNGAKFQVSGTATISGDLGVGRIPSSGYKVDIQGNGGLRILDNDILRSIILTPPTSAGAAANVESTSANGLNLNSSNASGFVTISTAGSTRLTIASTGAATFSSSVTALNLDLKGTATVQGNTFAPIDFYNSGNIAAAIRPIRYNDETAADLTFWTRAYLGSITERMRITYNGNVGIGTASPTARLSVQWDKSTAFAGSAVYDSQAFNASNHGGTLAFGGTFNSGGSYTEWSAIGGMKSNTTDGNVSGDINFYTRLNSSAMTERMRITSSGNVGIGTASPDANSRLDVNGQTFVAHLAIYNNNGTPSLGTSPMLYSPASGTIAISTNASERMRITSGGNVGIGTTNATGQSADNRVIQIYGAGVGNRAQIHFVNSDSGESTTDGSFIGIDFSRELYIINRENAATVFENNGSESMRITSGRNVLIGTQTDNGERLTLNGRIGIVGATVASGNYRSFFVRGSQNVADGGTLTINVTNTSLIFIAENNTGTGALFFCGYTSATITKISDPSNMFDTADTAGKLCIFKSAVSDVATIKNRLGSTRNITVSFIGVSD